MATWPPATPIGITLKDVGGGVYGSAIPAVLTARLVASRTTGVSPMTVVFSSAETQDPARDSHEVYRELGYSFDFDDASSGNFSVGENAGTSRNVSAIGPIVSHTFIVDDGGGSVDFDVLVRVKNPEGVESLASVTVTCQAQDDYYSAANTIAVSNTLSLAADWTTYDTPAPLGATKQSTLPDWDEFDGKRIMLFRGDDFTGETINDILIRSGQKNCVVTFFGADASPKPIVDRIFAGAGKTNGGFDITDAQVIDFGGWCENITFDRIEASQASNAISFVNIGYYDIDMDAEAKSAGGFLSMAAGSNWVYGGNGLTPSNVPFPYGAYVDKCNIVGSTTSLPLINIGAFNAPYILWSGISETIARKADEHNCRIMTWQNLAIHDNDMQGEHLGGGGGKHRITIRAEGYNQTYGDLTGQTFGIQSNTEPSKAMSSLGVVAANTLTPSIIGSSTSGIKVGPSNTTSLGLIDDVIVGENSFATTILNSTFDILLAGRYITTIGNLYHTGSSGTQDQGATFDLNAIVPLTPNYIDASAVPVPTAPR